MKILVLSDQESRSIYDFYSPDKLEGVELIIACGDLKPSYLEFFATMAHAPVIYVLGNHDKWYPERQAGGCTCVEDIIYEYNGIRILGLGGSMRYLPDAKNQYSEKEMQDRIKKLRWKLFRKKGFDILVAHSPIFKFNDLEDLPHRGFACFRTLIEQYSPKLFIHGHVHANYNSHFKREDMFGNTKVINAFEHYIFEYPTDNSQ